LARRDDGDKKNDAAALEGATLEHASAPPGCAPASSVASVSFGTGASDGVVDMADEDAAPPRRRALPGLEATAPLAVGPSKGLAAVLVGSRRIALLDLEEDECDEDDSDEDEEEHE
jgi:anaphase-promoting complex subunit 4